MKPRHLIVPSCALALLAACATPADQAAPVAAPSPTPTMTEVSAFHPRVVLAHEGGLTTVDASTGATLAATPLDGFVRLNDAGDGRHVLLTQGDRFRVFDGALTAERHGDHAHYFAGTPRLTDTSYEAPKAGHVVAHGGHTTLFGDGDGSIQVIDTDAIADPRAQVRRLATDAPPPRRRAPASGRLAVPHPGHRTGALDAPGQGGGPGPGADRRLPRQPRRGHGSPDRLRRRRRGGLHQRPRRLPRRRLPQGSRPRCVRPLRQPGRLAGVDDRAG